MFKWLGDKLGYRVFTLEEFELHRQVQDKTVENTALELTLERSLNQKLSGELQYYRERYDGAMERADRAQDALNMSNGLPEVTTTVVRERQVAEAKATDDVAARQVELTELFAEQIGTMHDEYGLELPPELQEEAERMLEGGTNVTR